MFRGDMGRRRLGCGRQQHRLFGIGGRNEQLRRLDTRMDVLGRQQDDPRDHLQFSRGGRELYKMAREGCNGQCYRGIEPVKYKDRHRPHRIR